MQYKKEFLLILIIALLLSAPLAIRAQQEPSSSGSSAGVQVAGAATVTLPEILRDKLAGIKATGELKQYGRDNLGEVVADKAVVYQEYLVVAASSRQYADARVDIFQAESPFAALGLFTYSAGAVQPGVSAKAIGSDSVELPDGLIFWEGNYFVRVTSADGQDNRRKQALHARLAAAVSELIIPQSEKATQPPLLEGLPRHSALSSNPIYFLGPESLNTYVERGREMFGFAGDAEAVMAEYKQSENAPGPLKLVIVEYHTPQFAVDAINRVNRYMESLAEGERNRIIVKREGNYIVEAVNVENRDLAQQLIDSINYPYTVKWLRDPLLPTNDPFRQQKAAQMLLSTFSLLGLMIATALIGGAAFGATVFLKRRKKQQEIFSDAGSMLRLDLDPFEAVIFELPPKGNDD